MVLVRENAYRLSWRHESAWMMDSLRRTVAVISMSMIEGLVVGQMLMCHSPEFTGRTASLTEEITRAIQVWKCRRTRRSIVRESNSPTRAIRMGTLQKLSRSPIVQLKERFRGSAGLRPKVAEVTGLRINPWELS